jgi:hypothetical protein
LISIAINFLGFKHLQAIRALIPIPPNPKTDIIEFFFGLASFNTSPNPVGIAHPNKIASLKFKFLGFGDSLFSETIVYSLKVVTGPH